MPPTKEVVEEEPVEAAEIRVEEDAGVDPALVAVVAVEIAEIA
jgi:hypothetical protein